MLLDLLFDFYTARWTPRPHRSTYGLGTYVLFIGTSWRTDLPVTACVLTMVEQIALLCLHCSLNGTVRYWMWGI
jgi:hypothetical protein